MNILVVDERNSPMPSSASFPTQTTSPRPRTGSPASPPPASGLYDAVIMDGMLPGMDAHRGRPPAAAREQLHPCSHVTARNSTSDKVVRVGMPARRPYD